jgi:hypothetical protein
MNKPFLILVRTKAACPEHSRESRRSPKPRGIQPLVFRNQDMVYLNRWRAMQSPAFGFRPRPLGCESNIELTNKFL